MGSTANISHNLKQIESAFRWGIMHNCPIGAATSVFELLGIYPDGRIQADGEAGDTSFPAGCGRIGSIGLTGLANTNFLKKSFRSENVFVAGCCFCIRPHQVDAHDVPGSVYTQHVLSYHYSGAYCTRISHSCDVQLLATHSVKRQRRLVHCVLFVG